MAATVTHLPVKTLPAVPEPLPPACYLGLAGLAADRGLPVLAAMIRGLARVEAASSAAILRAALP